MKTISKFFIYFSIFNFHSLFVSTNDSCQGDYNSLIDNEEWSSFPQEKLPFDNSCNLEKIHFKDINEQQFLENFLHKPVVLLMNDDDYQKEIRKKTWKSNLLKSHGEIKVTLSSSNSYSYFKRKGI